LPQSVDWRTKNILSPVQDQDACAGCWAFSTSGAVEAAHAIKHGNLVALSAQQLIDCSSSAGNMGCGGGWIQYAYKWLASNSSGLCALSDYPFAGKTGSSCQTTCSPVARVHSYVQVESSNEKALQAAVVNQPVSVVINADPDTFLHYKEGIYADPACNGWPDHAVLLVGYGTSDDGQDYWIVKNS
jgi:cathepsin L